MRNDPATVGPYKSIRRGEDTKEASREGAHASKGWLAVFLAAYLVEKDGPDDGCSLFAVSPLRDRVGGAEFGSSLLATPHSRTGSARRAAALYLQ